jgi:hypothetical protein
MSGRAATLVAFFFAELVVAISAGAVCAQVNVTTYHYDNYRTGWNQNESILTQGNVSDKSFGLLASVTLDDQVDAQPLVVNGVTIGGAQHNVVYVATESNSVYAIDAQSGQVLLQTNLGSPVSWPQGCDNNGPNVGINSTPVIDAANGILYVIAYTLQNSTPIYTLHALSLGTLTDTVAPETVSASGTLSNGKTYKFNAATQRQRPALLLANNTIYAGFGSFCDFAADDSRGWVLGWQAGTLAPLAANKLNNIRPKSPDSFFLTSVWMSGYGLAANSAGSVYFVTGNSDYSGTSYGKTRNIAESAAEVSSNLSAVQGLFTPTDRDRLDQDDTDFGSGGLMLLPPQPGKFPDIAAAAGKDGNLYLLDADNLGKELGDYQIGGCWCGPSYYQGSDGSGRIVTSGNTTVGVWTLSGKGAPKLTSVSHYSGIADGMDPGFFTSVSSNGTTAGSAIVWAVGRPVNDDPADVDLYAIDPDNGTLLFSEIAGQWPNTGGNSNIVPVVANGLVYVASNKNLDIFGPGGRRKAGLEATRHTDSRPPLPPGQHEIYATVVSASASSIVVRTREGASIRIDPANAKANHRFAEPVIGSALAASGRYDQAGVLNASSIGHAKNRSAMWPSDR